MSISNSITTEAYREFMTAVVPINPEVSAILGSGVLPRDISSFEMRKNGSFEIKLLNGTEHEKNEKTANLSFKGYKATIAFKNTIKGKLDAKTNSIQFDHDCINVKVDVGIVNMSASLRELGSKNGNIVATARAGYGLVGKNVQKELSLTETVDVAQSIEWND